MHRPWRLLLLGLLFCLPTAACDLFSDGATRIAYQIKDGVKKLERREGAVYHLTEVTPEGFRQCSGPYTVQFDRVGAVIVWCRDTVGTTVSSHSTSYHRRFVTTEATTIIDKGTGETLTITLERRGSRAHLTAVR
ncbi:hypothetical protein [Desulfofustis limnaeus]|jgi:hypothetical protein|uniref:Lipocalin-like domain-containing protein n=1 Tax=Desulfofustis limnaeus TaxID=2740163 RepID=A0ABN6M609_9BACT|nr:hypothetical protein [Desulfofustis limnaeus]MDX9895932.1 hypothetical protein [Desulfofustis sp.]BDD86547.1 hypothetical protein DPPLL_09120 [Desulfofustis limnaeus]